MSSACRAVADVSPLVLILILLLIFGVPSVGYYHSGPLGGGVSLGTVLLIVILFLLFR
jgi:hypothetical protein